MSTNLKIFKQSLILQKGQNDKQQKVSLFRFTKFELKKALGKMFICAIEKLNKFLLLFMPSSFLDLLLLLLHFHSLCAVFAYKLDVSLKGKIETDK